MTHDVPSLRKVLNPIFLKYGFEKTGTVWQRTVNGFTDVVDLQRSVWDSTCTLNVGIYVAEVYFCADFVPPKKLTAANGIVETRAGKLTSSGKTDVWWSLNDPSIVDSMLNAFQNHILPFFDSYHSFDQMIEFLESHKFHKKLTSPHSYYLAALYILTDQDVRGCEILKAMSLKPKATWNVLAQKLAVKYQCKNVD